MLPSFLMDRRSTLVDEDQRVVLWDVAWQDYEALLAIRGERPKPRIYYLDGAIELVSTSKTHEYRKKTLGRLFETWATERRLDVNGFGQWTLKKELKEAGAEPDECYIIGDPEPRTVPDLAIEIEWSRVVGLDKHEIYRRLGVRELWTLKHDGGLVVRVLERGRWVIRSKSKLFPKLDLDWLVAFLEIEPQSKAVRALLDELRKRH